MNSMVAGFLLHLPAVPRRRSGRGARGGSDIRGDADRSGSLFFEDAVTVIHQGSRGCLRAMNNLAVSALIATYAGYKSIVDQEAAQSVVTENSE
ncbi:hypothetical protein ACIGB6_01990 [Paeniglutamicibacter gangotriensis]|uniref:hypothetical protein n=1 Tax=Paeniglutamicibacter gangotriensis TaxID=254787 RepID=UPI0037C6013B